MRYSTDQDFRLRSLLACALLVLLGTIFAVAQHEQVLYAFGTQLSDGGLPHSGLIVDALGNFYGTTFVGGTNNAGTVYEISPSNPGWTETVLYSFSRNEDGYGPFGNLVFDLLGNLYGTTSVGGNGDCLGGCGTVFELSPPVVQGGSWTETILYSFNGGNDGQGPTAGVVFDESGNLYGTTGYGGNNGSCAGGPGCGTVFELSPPVAPGGTWTENVLYSFTGSTDGKFPLAPVVIDTTGKLYGMTNQGGGGICGCGVVFQLTPTTNGNWTETVIHSFDGSSKDGSSPEYSGLLMDKAGRVAGTTLGGGAFRGGTVFAMKPPSQLGGNWAFAVLYNFGSEPNDGQAPQGSVIVVDGKLYGTTAAGGAHAAGTAFQLAPSSSGVWKETASYSFRGGSDGAVPDAGLLFYRGAMFGTTGQGGIAASGTVFRIGP